VVLVLQRLGGEIDDNLELFEMSKADNDEAGLVTLEEDTARITTEIEKLEFRRMFNQPADPSNCFVDLQAGAGGTEACDWAQMLLRQYLKYAERKGFKATVEDETAGDVAGLKSATIKIEGEYAYGATPRSHRFLSTRKSTTRSTSTSTPPMCGSTPTAPAARVVSTSTKPTRRCA
jgi:peptide chain release factor 2